MWVIAGVLIGLVVLAAAVGFHTGPHAHAASGVIGVLAAGWLVLMAVNGRSTPVVWALFSADLVISAGVGALAWFGLVRRDAGGSPYRTGHLEGAEGVAVGDLDPEGVVRVRGEEWSAVCVNGRAPAGTRVQVLRASSLRVEVWGEEAEMGARPKGRAFELGPEGLDATRKATSQEAGT